jgi:uncharacterized DUF497 family protein
VNCTFTESDFEVKKLWNVSANGGGNVGRVCELNCTSVIYEWDAGKVAVNLKKHRVSFEHATSVFLDPLALTFPDPDHSAQEHREITIGSYYEKGTRVRLSLRARETNPHYQRTIGYASGT